MPAVARKNGTDTVSTGHSCDASTYTDEGSSTVFVNSIGVVRHGDANKSHNIKVGKSCKPHTVTLSTYSSKVFADGLGIGRQGDSYGSEDITSGSGNVFAG